VVILSLEILTFHNFSEALIDADVTNAIYLVGSSGYLRAKSEGGAISEYGYRPDNAVPNNYIYILWK
jgi:hypothetical protein